MKIEKRPSLRKCVSDNCKTCIYDPKSTGTWRQQVTLCSVHKCELWDVRPTTDTIPESVIDYYGDIESMKIGRRRLSTPDAIDRFIARMAAGELTASELRKNASRQLISVAGQESRLCNRNTLEHRIKRS